MDEEISRPRLILELEQFFNKKVFALVYNPHIEEGIKEGDEKYIMYFIESILKKENIKECVLIINGFGGHLKTSILCSNLLRNNLQKYECFVPSVIGSSLCYFVLQSDKLLIGEKSILTQIDPIFNHEGEILRAIKYLSEKNDISKQLLAHNFFNPVFENLKYILLTQPHVFKGVLSKKKKIRTDYIVKIVDLFMGGEFHESGLSIRDLLELNINYRILNEEIVKKANLLVQECRKELVNENYRFVIQTNKIDENYEGGYFFP